jgi:hypothetical protein
LSTGRGSSLAAVVLLAAATLALGASQAHAEEGSTYFCQTYLKTDEACNGSWHHLFFVEGSSITGTVCVDAYLDPKNNGHYTSEHCSTGSPYFFSTDEWGYPRIWPHEPTDVSGFEQWGPDG